MNGESGAAPVLDVRAVGVGVLWGIGILLLGSVLHGLIGFSSPLSAGAEMLLPLFWNALAGLFGGFQAARRAAGSGWLHGALAGVCLVLSMAAVMGVTSALPTMAAVLKFAGIGAGAGILGGIAGVNMGRS
jgi:putative membrane protein (TIGR04086 family)